MSHQKIDMVYTWVNHRDKNWQDKFYKYKSLSSANEAIRNCRFYDNDELKFSLRSLEKFAPWINHIYIITDNQNPKWLNVDHPKITLVNHCDILPSEALPTFNSNAIEMCLCNISGLSEYFLYGNDDTFFGNYVSSSFFYTPSGYPICRFFRRISPKPTSLWEQALNNSANCLTKHNYNFPKLQPHHNIDAYRKSIISECKNIFMQEAKNTENNKFRTEDDIERNIFSLYAVATKKGIKKEVYRYDRHKIFVKRFIKYLLKGSANESCYWGSDNPNIEKEFNNYLPKLFCINDNENTTSKDRKRIKNFLEKIFPDKSCYEK